jgi:hypothetical protein
MGSSGVPTLAKPVAFAMLPRRHWFALIASIASTVSA